MMYGSWDIECDGQNFLSFWTIFCPFTPITTRKIIILKNWKNYLEISSFYTSVPKIMIICSMVPEIWHVIFHFKLFFAFYLPNSPKNQNLKKMKKTSGDTIILDICTKNWDQMMYGSWDIMQNRRTDGKSDV